MRQISLRVIVILAAETSRFVGDKKLSLFWPFFHPLLLDQTKLSKVIVPCSSPCRFAWSRMISNVPMFQDCHLWYSRWSNESLALPSSPAPNSLSKPPPHLHLLLKINQMEREDRSPNEEEPCNTNVKKIKICCACFLMSATVLFEEVSGYTRSCKTCHNKLFSKTTLGSRVSAGALMLSARRAWSIISGSQ